MSQKMIVRLLRVQPSEICRTIALLACAMFLYISFMFVAGISAAASNNGSFFDITRLASGGWGFGNSDLTDTFEIAVSTVTLRLFIQSQAAALNSIASNCIRLHVVF